MGQSPYVASPSRVSSLCSQVLSQVQVLCSQVPSQVQVNTDKSQVKSKSWTFCFESQPSPYLFFRVKNKSYKSHKPFVICKDLHKHVQSSGVVVVRLWVWVSVAKFRERNKETDLQKQAKNKRNFVHRLREISRLGNTTQCYWRPWFLTISWCDTF